MALPVPAELQPERLARIRLIFSDLDETLLGPDHRVGERSRRAIAELVRRGVEFVICTGRAPQATWPIARELGTRYVICCNGACVYDGQTLLADRALSGPLTAEMVDFFVARDCPTYLMAPAGYFVSHVTPVIEEANRVRGIWPEVLPRERWAQPAWKVMPWGAAHLYEEAVARWGQAANIIYHPDYLEIAPPGVSKAWGARVLAQRLGVAPEEVAAIGDARNDIELVAWAGVGVAMGNADPLLKAQADAVARDHGQDGAADLFEAILAAR